jgi:hypothetical protein
MQRPAHGRAFVFLFFLFYFLLLFLAFVLLFFLSIDAFASVVHVSPS